MVRARNWGTSNIFSENHRKCLPENICLWDIDGFFIDADDKIAGLYEGKYKMETKDRGHFINTFDSKKNLQAEFLKILSRKITIWICEESTQKWWSVKNGVLEISKNPDLQLINTENRIYVENFIRDSNHYSIAVFIRTEGEKPCELEKYSNFISKTFNIKNVLVNDIHENNNIFFKCGDKTVKTEINESKNISWINSWRELEIIPNHRQV